MRNIKDYLRKVGLSKQDLANEIYLSRPTLDTYIDLFEQGKSIPKERYQIVFDKLFKRELEKEEFKKRLYSLRKLLERDKRLGTEKLSAEAADYVSRLRNRMESDMMQKGWDKSIYSFIDTLIRNYRDEDVIKKMAEYTSFLNGYIHEYQLKEKDKAIFAYFYKALEQLNSNSMDLDGEAYERLIIRRKEIIEDRRRRGERYKKQINDAIQSTIKEMDAKGIKATKEEMVEVVMDKIKKIKL